MKVAYLRFGVKLLHVGDYLLFIFPVYYFQQKNHLKNSYLYAMKAIETTGSLEKSGILKLDKPIPVHKKQKVKIIILYDDGANEIDDKEWLTSLSGNESFAFFKNKKEDIYSVLDGKPFKL